MRTLFNTVIIFWFVSLSISAAVFVEMTLYAAKPIHAYTIEKKIEIAPGEQFKTTLDHLTSSGLIKHPFKFRLLARIKKWDKHIKAGEFLVSTHMSPTDLLETLVSGRVILYRLTIPEGLNMTEIAAMVERRGWGNQAEFLSMAKDPDLIGKSGFEAHTLEGYLFPETYFFPKNVTVKNIIQAMTHRFKTVFNEQWERRAGEIGLTVHEVVTLASIIEKETGDEAERPIIASVFHNRLKKKMRLESDPTVIYDIADFNGNLTRKHLRTATPHNTYKIKGLPPGPIASPGYKSLEAALYPADTDFLFFVSKKDGTHYFSKTISAHKKAVNKYQLSR